MHTRGRTTRGGYATVGVGLQASLLPLPSLHLTDPYVLSFPPPMEHSLLISFCSITLTARPLS